MIQFVLAGVAVVSFVIACENDSKRRNKTNELIREAMNNGFNTDYPYKTTDKFGNTIEESFKFTRNEYSYDPKENVVSEPQLFKYMMLIDGAWYNATEAVVSGKRIYIPDSNHSGPLNDFQQLVMYNQLSGTEYTIVPYL
jgi:hypothetical protein